MVATNAMNTGSTGESLDMELPTIPAMVEMTSMLPTTVLVSSVIQANAPQIAPSKPFNTIRVQTMRRARSNGILDSKVAACVDGSEQFV